MDPGTLDRDLPGPHVQPDSPGGDAAQIARLEMEPVLLQQLQQGILVAFANVEDPAGVQNWAPPAALTINFPRSAPRL